MTISPGPSTPRPGHCTDLSASRQCRFRSSWWKHLQGAAEAGSTESADLSLAAAHPAAGSRCFFHRWSEGEGCSGWWVLEWEQKCARAAGEFPRPHWAGSLGSCVRAPAQAPTPSPGGGRQPVYFSLPYSIWPPETPRQTCSRRRLQARQQTGASTLLGDVAGSGPVTQG